MKRKAKLKIFVGSKTFKSIVSVFLTTVLLLIIIVPSILTMRPKWSAISFGRDVTSGTRQAFVEKVLGRDLNDFSPGMNVREAKNNESMIKLVVNNKNSISYVSFGTVANFDENDKANLKNNFKSKSINYVTLNGVNPDRENLINGTYPATRNFNIFFRVNKNSNDAKILDSKWDNGTFENPNSLKNLNNDIKASYLFYSWAFLSEQAKALLKEESEVSSKNPKIDFTKSLVDSYIKKVELDLEEKVTIEIVGSSSARKVLDLLSTNSEDSFINVAKNEWSFSDIEFIKATNGSGDAFRRNIAGTMNPYIGLQSREPGDIELSKWGWKKENIDLNNNPYKRFAIDALLIIYNTKSLEDSNKRRNVIINNKSNKLNDLYSSNNFVRFTDIFETFSINGGMS